MLYEAAGPEPGEPDPGPSDWIAEGIPALYLDGWGRSGDIAVVAETAERALVGAAWFRLYFEHAHGWGFVDEQTPELAIAVVEAFRRRGVGRALLENLIARAREARFGALSLSTLENTSGARLYESLGFRRVGEFEELAVMRMDLTQA